MAIKEQEVTEGYIRDDYKNKAQVCGSTFRNSGNRKYYRNQHKGTWVTK